MAELLGEQDLYVWDGDYYALEPMRALGIDDSGGAVRAGFLHYTTEDEVDRLLEALADLAAASAALCRSPARIARSQARRIAALPGRRRASSAGSCGGPARRCPGCASPS